MVLLDEIEKAHPDVFNMLLQVLDDGRLTDSHGRTVSFRNTVVIMTSNAPRDSLKEIFRPEFLNRLDEILEFDALSRDQIREIVRLQLGELEKRLADEGFNLQVSDAAVEVLLEDGYDPQFGARPVKRAIQRDLENPIAKKIIAGEYMPGSTIRAQARDSHIVLE